MPTRSPPRISRIAQASTSVRATVAFSGSLSVEAKRIEAPRSHHSTTDCAVCHSLSCTKLASDLAERRQSMLRAWSVDCAGRYCQKVVAGPCPAAPMIAQDHRAGQMLCRRQQRGQGTGLRLGAGAQGQRIGHAARAVRVASAAMPSMSGIQVLSPCAGGEGQRHAMLQHRGCHQRAHRRAWGRGDLPAAPAPGRATSAPVRHGGRVPS